MAFLRKKTEELTGYQQNGYYDDRINFQNDFVMVYGTGDNVCDRIKSFADKGYVTHLMTGVAWGEYQDYLYGKFDGREHFDEGQRDRNGKEIAHGHDVPYMVPTISFCDYLTEKLKPAIDSGVVAIHLEEPEFWDHAGYSEAFKREYKLYYRTEFVPAHESLDAAYKAAKLKSYLYARAIDRIFSALKEYAYVKYNRVVRFYVPTHSLVNYTQWKIISPEGTLIDSPSVDGFIAQIWTGTSRTPNMYKGIRKERTFETAYLEYGIMQELVAGTDKKMWFLHDPIEDVPAYTWENYEYNYKKTLAASLLHPKISTYEICPWPIRVFGGRYPRDPATHKPTDASQPIPPHYSTLLCNIFNTLGDMDQETNRFEGFSEGIGVFMSDTGLFQRTYPDYVCTPNDLSENTDPETLDPKARNAFASSILMPDFYGLTLPLLKDGLPVRPVLLDNLKRYPSYLDDYRMMILSYEFMKPESPDINGTLAAWVRNGGILIYCGNSEDPYHGMTAWWNHSKGRNYADPADHLFELLGLDGQAPDQLDGNTFTVGKGMFACLRTRPLDFCVKESSAFRYRDFIRSVLEGAGMKWEFSNHLTLNRGKYIISAVMDETSDVAGKTFEGLYCDMLTPRFDIITKKVVNPDENALLLDFSRITQERTTIIGTTNRIDAFEDDGHWIRLTTKGATDIEAFLRIRLPRKPIAIESTKALTHDWDEASGTALIQYASDVEGVEITIRLD